MTAELSRAFLTKREGVAFVLGSVESALGSERVHVFTVDGAFVTPDEARRGSRRPSDRGGSRWAASSRR